ncbi:FimV/HubP family polar landmark protein [Stutzerimonas urumqiensis]|uniref:FimV/HubP family polar landmark protein n=1 Tax=Stutzerimonas urumqiensis TaxID=638269 RepID=UPI000EB47C63|nr:FimV/HubP family polar landmark protein [Stutzerimonas urumqiensis]
MVRVRNLVLAIAAATALTTEMAYALGLGEVSLKSSLNQPLVAEIELLDAKSLGPGEVVPSLASVEAFNKAGVDRLYFLTDLKFTPVLRPDGKNVIRITSSKPVREPYLNFLVEVLWPNGRLLREYTLLLDPPLYSPETAAAVAPQLPITPQATQPVARQRAEAVQRPAIPASGPAAGAGEYRTTASDTLWEIAEQHRQGGTVHQTMLAIQDLNPNAFIGGNINRMLSGQVLRLPNEAQIGQRSQAEAIAQVAQQNAAWRQAGDPAPAGNRQVDATRRTEAGASPSQVETGDNLRLVAPTRGEATAGSDRGAAGDSKALADKLAVTQESLDSSRRENAELKDRLGDLQSQLDNLQRLMALKDDQLAKLQAQLATDASQASTSAQGQPLDGAPVSSEAPSEEAVAPESIEAPVAPSASAPSPDQGEAGQPEPATASPAPAAPAAQPEPTQPAVAPVPVAETPEEGLIEGLLEDPVTLGLVGGGALLLVLIGLMALSRRNAAREAELQESLASEHSDTFGLGQSQAFTHDLAEPEEGIQHAPLETAKPHDVIAESDIYIAYGRFNQAADLLQSAANDEPQRTDIRLKLMEVYAELGDRQGFARQEAELREIGGANAEIDRLKAKFPSMVPAVAGAGLAGAGAASYAAMSSTDSDELNLDDLDLELDDPVRDASPAADDEVTLDDLALEFDALDNEPLEPKAGELTDGPASPDASFDNQYDLSDDLLALDEATLAPASDSELDLNLDEQPLVEQDPLADFDFELSDLDQQEATIAEQVDSTDQLDTPATSSAFDTQLPDDFDLAIDEAPAEPYAPAELANELDAVSAELDDLSDRLAESAEPVNEVSGGSGDALDEEFDFLSDADETATKLDLARAYIDMGDADGARDILDEVMSEGSDLQQQEAREMLARLG